VETSPSVYSSVFEDITLSGQKVAGWRLGNHPLTIRHLTSVNKVPAFVSPEAFEGGQLVLLDSRLSGGSNEQAAIDNSKKGKWGDNGLFLRNVTVEG